MIPRFVMDQLNLEPAREAPQGAAPRRHLQRVPKLGTVRARVTALLSRQAGLPLHRRHRDPKPLRATGARVLEFPYRCRVCGAASPAGCAHLGRAS